MVTLSDNIKDWEVSVKVIINGNQGHLDPFCLNVSHVGKFLINIYTIMDWVVKQCDRLLRNTEEGTINLPEDTCLERLQSQVSRSCYTTIKWASYISSKSCELALFGHENEPLTFICLQIANVMLAQHGSRGRNTYAAYYGTTETFMFNTYSLTLKSQETRKLPLKGGHTDTGLHSRKYWTLSTSTSVESNLLVSLIH